MAHGILFPLPLNYHLIYVAVSVIVLIISYIHSRHLYKLFLMSGIVGTLLVYADDSRTFFVLLGSLEFTVLIITIIMMRRSYKSKNSSTAIKKRKV